MKKRFLAALISIVLTVTALGMTFSATADVALETADYKLMAQNLLMGGDDARHNAMIDRILANDPDIITMQEANEAWIKYLTRSDNAVNQLIYPDTDFDDLSTFQSTYELFYQYRKSDNKESVPVAYKKEKFNLIDSGHFWLSDTPDVESAWEDAYCHRIVTWIALQDKTTGDKIGLLSIHLDLVAACRERSIPLILDKVAELEAAYPGIMILAAGDYNCGKGSNPYNAMIAGGFYDSRYKTANTTGDTTDHPTFYTGSIIDHVLANAAVTPKKFEALTNDYGYTNSDTEYGISDHYGLLLTFSPLKDNRGNMDADGVLSTADAVRLMRYLNKWLDADAYLADVNADGKTNTWDVVLLLRKLGGVAV